MVKAMTRLEGGPASAGRARRFINDVLRRERLDDVDEVVVLLTNELVTNAILHTGSDIDLMVELVSGGVRVEVGDRSERLPRPHPVVSELSASGHGLELVEAMARSWGVERLPGSGKRVWFEVGV